MGFELAGTHSVAAQRWKTLDRAGAFALPGPQIGPVQSLVHYRSRHHCNFDSRPGVQFDFRRCGRPVGRVAWELSHEPRVSSGNSFQVLAALGCFQSPFIAALFLGAIAVPENFGPLTSAIAGLVLLLMVAFLFGLGARLMCGMRLLKPAGTSGRAGRRSIAEDVGASQRNMGVVHAS